MGLHCQVGLHPEQRPSNYTADVEELHAVEQRLACSPKISSTGAFSLCPCLQVIGAADEPGCGMANWWAEAQEIDPENMQES